MTRHLTPRYRLLVLFALIGFALTLRVPISGLAVVLGDVRADLRISTLEVSLLTGLPVLCFALIGGLAGRSLTRLGLARGALIVLVSMAAATLVRALAASAAVFILATVVCLAAIAVGNVLLPAVAKEYFPDRMASVSAMYGAAIMGGSSLGAIESGLLGERWGWRIALGAVVVITLLLIPAWLPLLAHESAHNTSSDEAAVSSGARYLRAIPLVFCFGLAGAQAYAQMGWYPEILKAAGLSTVESSIAFAILTGAGVPAMLAMPSLVKRWGNCGCICIYGAATALGWAGVLLAPTSGTWIWSALIGIGGGAFGWSMSMIGHISRSSSEAAMLSSFVQGAGFTLAALGPFGVGYLQHDTGDWSPSIVLLILMAVGIAVAGALASRAASAASSTSPELVPVTGTEPLGFADARHDD